MVGLFGWRLIEQAWFFVRGPTIGINVKEVCFLYEICFLDSIFAFFRGASSGRFFT